MFRIIARRNKLLGDWAARLMGSPRPRLKLWWRPRSFDFESGGKDVVLTVATTGAGVDVDSAHSRSPQAQAG